MELFNYKGIGGCDCTCGLDFIIENNDDIMVVITQLPDMTGTSVTNYFEHIATLIYLQKLSGYPLDKIKWIEHYTDKSSITLNKKFDIVTMDWDGNKFSNPKWNTYNFTQNNIQWPK